MLPHGGDFSALLLTREIGLRDYGIEPSHWPPVSYAPMAGLPAVEVEAWTGCLGSEPTPTAFVGHLVHVMRLVRRVLRDDGSLWLNLGDSSASKAGGYDTSGSRGTSAQISAKTQASVISHKRRKPPAGLKEKDLTGIPWRVAFALQADGWWLRSEIIWAKGLSFCEQYAGSAMPESVTDRPSRTHEQVFLLTKKAKYYYDAEAVKETAAQSTQDRAYLGARPSSPQALALQANGTHGKTKTLHDYSRSTRNLRSVWVINPGNFDMEVCSGCHRVYTATQYKRLKAGANPLCKQCSGSTWAVEIGGGRCKECQTYYTNQALKALKRDARCRCGSDQWIGHFAVFPDDLVAPMILAGTSERGICPACLAPYERVVERQAGEYDDVEGRVQRLRSTVSGGVKRVTLHRTDQVTTKTTGWRPTCDHTGGLVSGRSAPIPATVLDPFAGTGVTAEVAQRLGRRAIVIDRSGAYVQLAQDRLAQRELFA